MLSAEDKAALSLACGWPGDEHADLTAAVEQIVARHVTAFKADLVEKFWQAGDRMGVDAIRAQPGSDRARAIAAMNAYNDAARIAKQADP